ncbi:hypothetical protein ACFV3O_18610 [Streptomyces albidoflavus]
MELPVREEELQEIEELCSAATPGPWHARALDDDSAMNLVAVSTVPGAGAAGRWPDFDHRDLVAATHGQHPPYVDGGAVHGGPNAGGIARARETRARLVEEVRRLRALLADEGEGVSA